MYLLLRLYRHIGTALLVLALLGMGAYKYSRISYEQRRLLELEVGLEQLYLIEQAHFERHGRYFDPTELDGGGGSPWRWLECCRWEIGVENNMFWVIARADLDGDGNEGAWRIDGQNPQVQLLKDD